MPGRFGMVPRGRSVMKGSFSVMLFHLHVLEPGIGLLGGRAGVSSLARKDRSRSFFGVAFALDMLLHRRESWMLSHLNHLRILKSL